ncbi:MAG: ATP-binding domain-containing protein [Candidatus Accumulibacter phosphatis]|nr:ATP-binding domain-containing protein [Candidatus Accumulibacter phosphatis]
MAEWGREACRRQTGLLLTAHRAKGLEFDHVVVLGGDWLRSGANEDADATRRLYYVAMTRARKTLALARFDRGQAWLDALVGGMADSSFDSPAFLHRHATPLPTPPPELARRHRRLGWRQIRPRLCRAPSPRPRHSPGTGCTHRRQPDRASPNIGRRLATVRCARGRRRRAIAALRTGNPHARHRSPRRRHPCAPTAGRGGGLPVPDQRAMPILGDAGSRAGVCAG